MELVINYPVTLQLTQKQIEAIGQHGARDYPSECCGILLGIAAGSLKQVKELAATRNVRHDHSWAEVLLPLAQPGTESERNRFLMDPKDVQRVEAEGRARGLEVIGTYHSHPDHPARPSEYDREHAWPWLSYVIIKIEAGRAGDYASWVLADDRSHFENEPIDVVVAKSSGEKSEGP